MCTVPSSQLECAEEPISLGVSLSKRISEVLKLQNSKRQKDPLAPWKHARAGGM